MTRLFLIFVNKETFFKKEYLEIELKMFFITSEKFIEWQKQNIEIVTFKQVNKSTYIYIYIIYIYIYIYI